MYRFATVVLCLFVNACAVMPEGVYVAVPLSLPNIDDWSEEKLQLLENANSVPGVDNSSNVEKSPGVIVVGIVGPFRDFSTPRTINFDYQRYFEVMMAIGEESSIISESEFSNSFSGWTTVNVPTGILLRKHVNIALVPKEIENSIGFPSTTSTSMFSNFGDLVAAEYTLDGFFYSFVIKSVLCKEGEGYEQCADKFNLGFYDSVNGRELTNRLELKPVGYVIDTQSFELIH